MDFKCGCIISFCCCTDPINCSVHGWNENCYGMNTTNWGKEEECCEAAVVEVAYTVVDPRTVVIHL